MHLALHNCPFSFKIGIQLLSIRWRHTMLELKNPAMARFQTLLSAVSSWVFIFWLIGFSVFASRPYFFAGIIVSAFLWATVISASLALRCPGCGKCIAISTKEPQLGPDWVKFRKQFFPIDALLGNSEHMECPHCRTPVLIRIHSQWMCIETFRDDWCGEMSRNFMRSSVLLILATCHKKCDVDKANWRWSLETEG